MTIEGEPGWLCVFYSEHADGTIKDEVARYVLKDTRVKLNDFLPEGRYPSFFNMIIKLNCSTQVLGRNGL